MSTGFWAAIGVRQMDRQIKKRSLRLRVNLDGETPERIEEVKTHAAPVFHLSRAYWMQAQVEMFAANKPLEIVAYRLEPEDYGNFYRPIDPERITRTLSCGMKHGCRSSTCRGCGIWHGV